MKMKLFVKIKFNDIDFNVEKVVDAETTVSVAEAGNAKLIKFLADTIQQLSLETENKTIYTILKKINKYILTGECWSFNLFAFEDDFTVQVGKLFINSFDERFCMEPVVFCDGLTFGGELKWQDLHEEIPNIEDYQKLCKKASMTFRNTKEI